MSWPKFWQKQTLMTQILKPLGKWTCAIAKRRLKKFKAHPPKHPGNVFIIVVGNIVVGGSGKTPFIQWLGRELQRQSIPFGIISRGYGGKPSYTPYEVTPDSPAEFSGDEPLLLAQSLNCPVIVSPKRAEALAHLIEKHPEMKVVLSDDGLQHFALPRDLEVVLMDSERLLGNGLCLPAGPLREPASRLKSVDAIVCNGGKTPCEPLKSFSKTTPYYEMALQPLQFRQVNHPERILPLEAFNGKRVVAFAGIGNPERFFNALRELHIEVAGIPLKDHQAIDKAWLDRLSQENPDKPLIMTQKDAVKCSDYALQDAWYLEVAPQVSSELAQRIIQAIN
jgi:tetraacyldisaccharide 4'-kinase